MAPPSIRRALSRLPVLCSCDFPQATTLPFLAYQEHSEFKCHLFPGHPTTNHVPTMNPPPPHSLTRKPSEATWQKCLILHLRSQSTFMILLIWRVASEDGHQYCPHSLHAHATPLPYFPLLESWLPLWLKQNPIWKEPCASSGTRP